MVQALSMQEGNLKHEWRLFPVKYDEEIENNDGTNENCGGSRER